MKPLTLEWIAKAEADFAAAGIASLSTDIICFHCQQAVEKYLKGYLHEADVHFSKTHDLEELLELSLSLQPLWESWRRALSDLTGFATEFRYPGEWATSQDARTSLEIAIGFRKEVRSALQLHWSDGPRES